jgi:methylmalonyl-CoA/ethylmalonyl-CoA epimerase
MHIHHIALAVRDLDSALEFYRDALGVEVKERRVVPVEGVEIAFLPMGESEIELLQPLDMENSVGRFIMKRQEGIHHICLLVDDIETTVKELTFKDVRMATEIRSHPNGTRYAFIHPGSTHGVLLELYEESAINQQKTQPNE